MEKHKKKNERKHEGKPKIAIILIITTLLITISATGCGIRIIDETNKRKPFWEQSSENTVGMLHEYTELPNGIYEVKCETCNQTHIYKYKISITGRMNSAIKNSTFVYLSNLESITFDQAWKSAGFSSNMSDYFSHLDAILIELK